MNTSNKFLVLCLLVLFAACARSVEIPKTVNYDYNINFDFARLKTYDLSPTPTTVGIEHLMMERIKTAIDTQLQAKNVKKSASNPDFLVNIYGVRSKVFTTAWRGPGSDLILEKGKLILKFVEPQTNRVIWWGEARTILDPHKNPADETKMVNDVVYRILKAFPPAAS
jgi:hypothetical protein